LHNLTNSEVIFDLTKQEVELDKLEYMMSTNNFWEKDQKEIIRITQKRSLLRNKIDQYNSFYQEAEDARILAEMAVEEEDEAALKDLAKELVHLQKKLTEIELQTLLSDKDDFRNAILAINAGAGGTEAQDWVEMIFRMYLRWCEDKGMKIRVIDTLSGDEAGIKNITFTITGPYAYGYLKSEHGIHRMVRISPFDATGRRHTSFASVSVLPEIDTDIEINIEDKDLRIDTYRASGPGGQHVNKTNSAVRITHHPSGIVVQCQNEKSQHRNREMALKVLKSRLYESEINKQEQVKQDKHNTQKGIAWGSQIRSYTFNPYRLVKDHRTNLETGNVEKVMDGDIDPFIDAYLKKKAMF